MLGIIHETHISIGHVGRNERVKELNSKYENITIEIIVIFYGLFVSHAEKIGYSKKT